MTDVRSLPAPLTPATYELSLPHGGAARTFIAHVPSQAAAGGTLPVVLNFHGGGSNARQQHRYSAMDRTAERHGFVVVYPDGTGARASARRFLTWNAGGCCAPASRRQVDDVGFALAVVAALAAKTPLDPRRIFATGMSNGGMMAHRMAVDAGEQVAAVASVAGQLYVESFRPSRAVPVLELHSVDDARAAYEGRQAPRLTAKGRLRPFPSVEAGLRAWAAHDGCPPDPHLGAPLLGRAGTADAGQSATRLTWGPGRDGSEVVLVRLTGAGHVWPGATRDLPRLLGRATNLVDANEVIWAFFAAHPLPAGAA